MAPQAKSAPAKKNRRKSAAGPATPIMKSVNPRRSARLQNNSALFARPESMSQPAGTGRKRLRDTEPEAEAEACVHPAKRSQLSEANLQKLNGKEMHATLAPPIKRSSSQRSTSPAITQDTVQSQRSSGTTAYYRFSHLVDAQIYIHSDSPKDIQEAIDAVVKAEPCKERRGELKIISQVFHNECTENARAAIGEDDSVRPLLSALKAMSSKKLCLREKANWEEVLKPRIQQSYLELDFLADPSFTAGHQEKEFDATVTPQKRQRLEAGRSPIKTPRPDISIGTRVTALKSALSSQDFNSLQVQLFLKKLQNMMMYREPGGPQEPVLISIPAPRASDLAFPFAVVEGKAYSTGKQVFEAENQAAVAGACGLKMQLCLDELVERVAPTSKGDVLPAPNDQPALFFSICTQCPIHELWVHWTIVEDGIRQFHMKLLKICHGVLLEGAEDFIVTVDNVLRWGIGKFLDSVVERLRRVARNT